MDIKYLKSDNPSVLSRFIDDAVKTDRQSPIKEKMSEGLRYYDYKHDILKFRLFYYNEDGKLVEETKNAVYEGLKQVKPWGFLGDMGQAVNDYVKSKGYSVVREVGGHGIGLEFHEDPWVSYISKKGTEMLMVPGMIFTIEPMVNAGKPDIFVDEDNGWTIYTEDNSMSAQWEIQVLVTEDGYEIIAY